MYLTGNFGKGSRSTGEACLGRSWQLQVYQQNGWARLLKVQISSLSEPTEYTRQTRAVSEVIAWTHLDTIVHQFQKKKKNVNLCSWLNPGLTASPWPCLMMWDSGWPWWPSLGLSCLPCLGTKGQGPWWWDSCPVGHIFAPHLRQPAFAGSWQWFSGVLVKCLPC